MIADTTFTITFTDGTTDTYSVTPWVIAEYEKMTESSYVHFLNNFNEVEMNDVYLLTFLAVRESGATVQPWREPFIKSLAKNPVMKITNLPKEDPEHSTV